MESETGVGWLWADHKWDRLVKKWKLHKFPLTSKSQEAKTCLVPDIYVFIWSFTNHTVLFPFYDYTSTWWRNYSMPWVFISDWLTFSSWKLNSMFSFTVLCHFPRVTGPLWSLLVAILYIICFILFILMNFITAQPSAID